MICGSCQFLGQVGPKTQFSLKKCNNKLCYKPYFFTLLYNFKVDKEGIKTKHDGQLICFEFISPIQLKELSVL